MKCIDCDFEAEIKRVPGVEVRLANGEVARYVTPYMPRKGEKILAEISIKIKTGCICEVRTVT